MTSLTFTSISILPQVRPSVPLLVTERAIEAGAIRSMAVHAASHRDVRLLEEAVSLRNFAMAGFASRARGEMVLVAKENVTRNLIDAHPGDRLFPRGERGQSRSP